MALNDLSKQNRVCKDGFSPCSLFWRYIMRKLLSLVALTCTLAAGMAHAADPAKAAAPAAAPAAATAAAPAAATAAAPAAPTPVVDKTPQQSKMATCNKEAEGKKGDERKAFMKTCLSAKAEPAAKPADDPKSAQQSKMKTCNADAAGKKGDERKAFMSECLKSK
jgi:uncharacterized membrane protein YdfJ with MMPL/SSD domain